jgi:hypothetical protein
VVEEAPPPVVEEAPPVVEAAPPEPVAVEPPPPPKPVVAEPPPPPPPAESAQSEWAIRAGKWLKPIAGVTASGEDTRYDLDHSAARAEVEKLESVTSGDPDWTLVRNSCDSLLRGKTKDLTLASYLARALYELDGLDGLVTGMALIAETCERFWDGMYPPKKKERRRANAITWLFDPVEKRRRPST